MAQYDRMAVLNAIFDSGIVPVFYNKDPETTIHIVEACAKAGARLGPHLMVRGDERTHSARCHADPVLALLDFLRNANTHDRRLLLRYSIAPAEYV